MVAPDSYGGNRRRKAPLTLLFFDSARLAGLSYWRFGDFQISQPQTDSSRTSMETLQPPDRTSARIIEAYCSLLDSPAARLKFIRKAVARCQAEGVETPSRWPLYDRFRVIARHLVLAAFALAVLAGFGIATVQARALSRRVPQRAALSSRGPISERRMAPVLSASGRIS